MLKIKIKLKITFYEDKEMYDIMIEFCLIQKKSCNNLFL